MKSLACCWLTKVEPWLLVITTCWWAAGRGTMWVGLTTLKRINYLSIGLCTRVYLARLDHTAPAFNLPSTSSLDHTSSQGNLLEEEIEREVGTLDQPGQTVLLPKPPASQASLPLAFLLLQGCRLFHPNFRLSPPWTSSALPGCSPCPAPAASHLDHLLLSCCCLTSPCCSPCCRTQLGLRGRRDGGCWCLAPKSRSALCGCLEGLIKPGCP